ncbi:MAG: 50S ribosomal protein L24 [Gammaproteobacteria bacterium]|nr:50S ribosomal protein L24 [Gammaproteobacteria bacterium]
MRKIKKDDTVIVTAGKNKGMKGKVLKVLKEAVIVEGVNVIKKHIKPNPAKGVQGGIKEQEAAIHCSNVALINPATNQPEKVGIRFLEDGRKVRYFKSSNEVIDI